MLYTPQLNDQMIDFKFNNVTISAPSEWNEVSVGHFIQPQFLAGDSVGLLCALTGIERKVLLNATEDIMPKLAKMVEFYTKNPTGYKGELKKTIRLKGKKIKIPQDIELEYLGQKILFATMLGKYNFTYEAIPEAVAIYVAPQLHPEGEFDDAIVEEIIEDIKMLPITQVYPVADFFLDSLRTSLKSGTPSSIPFLQSTKPQTTSTNSSQETDSKSTENS